MLLCRNGIVFLALVMQCCAYNNMNDRTRNALQLNNCRAFPIYMKTYEWYRYENRFAG